MRLSVKKNDPGYSKNAYKYRPYLDGKKVDKCFTADEEKGFVDIYISGPDGDYVIKKDELQTKRLYGKVELKLERPTYATK